MRPAKLGDLRVVDRATLRRSCYTGIFVAFVGGYLAGIGSALLIEPAEAQPATRAVPAILLDVGQSLCREWGNLRNVKRVSESHYTFTCSQHAKFENVEITFDERKQP